MNIKLNTNQMKMTKLIRHLLLIAAFVVIGKTYAQTCPTGMISYWKMDDGQTTILDDFKGGIDGVYSGLIPDVTGIMSNTYAKDFDGSSNADIPNNAAYAFGATSSFTIEMWIKIGSSSTGSQILLGKGDGCGSCNAYWYVGIEDGTPFAVLKDGNNNVGYVTASSAIGPNIWHYIVLTRNESGDALNLYVDGSLVDTDIRNFTGTLTNTNIMTMGYLISGGGAGYFYNGHLDEVAVYNRALSATEITDHYTNASVRGVGYCDALYPVITSTPVNKATVNSAYSYAVKATGAKTIAYTLLTKPTGMTISSSTGVISWTPTTTNIDALVSVMASNAYPPADTQSFRIFLADATVCTGNAMLLLKLNETSGTTYDDAMAGGHDGSVVSTTAPYPTTAKTGYVGAQMFDATAGIDIPDNSTEFDWSSGASFSIEYWMKTSNSTSQVCVARHRNDYKEKVASWYVGIDGGAATFDLQDNDTTDGIGGYTPAIVGTTTVADNAWHHILAVRDGSQHKNILYVDGVEEANSTVIYANSFSADDPTAVTVGYMLRDLGKNAYHYTGAIDEVAIYNRAVSASEAATFFALPKGHCPEGNYIPVITSTPVTSATEEVAYSCTFTVDDADVADVLTLSAQNKPVWATFNWTPGTKTATLTGTPGNANVGSSTVVLRVNDGHVNKDQTFTLTVANVNDVPVITTTPTTSVNEDVAYSYTLTVTDEDAGDVVTINAVTLPSWLTFTTGTKTATIAGTPGNGNTGANPIDLTISDGTVTIHEAYVLTVNPINDLPVISGQVALSTDEDIPITISKSDLTITDVDNPDADISLTVFAGTNYTFSGLTITPNANYYGDLLVNVKANDLAGSSDPYQVTITVDSVNDAPVITSSPIVNVDVDNLYVYMFTVSDVDEGTTLTMSVVEKPTWLTFTVTNPTSAVLTGTPHASDGKQHLVILRVSDGDLDIDQQFTINVNGITAITEMKNQEFVIYPVPVNDVLNIKFNSLQEETTVDLISSTGSIVESVMVPANSELANIPVSNLEAGIYFCHIKNSSLNNISRFLIVR
jgi:hypothetical protein